MRSYVPEVRRYAYDTIVNRSPTSPPPAQPSFNPTHSKVMKSTIPFYQKDKYDFRQGSYNEPSFSSSK